MTERFTYNDEKMVDAPKYSERSKGGDRQAKSIPKLLFHFHGILTFQNNERKPGLLVVHSRLRNPTQKVNKSMYNYVL